VDNDYTKVDIIVLNENKVICNPWIKLVQDKKSRTFTKYYLLVPTSLENY
jgi:hypothetical protein